MSALLVLLGAPTVIVVIIAILSATVLQKAFKVHDPASTPLDLIVLVTGASSGIGLDAAVELAKRGYQVYGTVRNEKAAEKLKSIDLGKTKGQLMPIEMDVTDYDSVAKVFDKIKGDVDAGAVFVALVNNAGYGYDGPAEDNDEAEVKKVFDINVFGVMHITKLFIPLARANRGRIVTVGSLAGVGAVAFSSAYASSKFAIEGYNDALRRELVDHGVSVSLIEPGLVATEMTTEDKLNEILHRMSKDLQKVYAKELAALMHARKGGPKLMAYTKDSTTPAIVDAVMNKYPKTRYVVAGYGMVPGWFLSLFSKFVPDRLQDYVFSNL